MNRPSTADRFIEVMARINALDGHRNNDEPMRHQVGMLKNEAFNILDHAIESAGRLAAIGHDIPKQARDNLKEALAAKDGGS